MTEGSGNLNAPTHPAEGGDLPVAPTGMESG